jgi:hypothetical protein
LPTKQIEHTDELGDGSEKPTLAKGSTDNLKKETGPLDFRSRKVFLIPSKKIFWGKGRLISSEGRDIMATFASFLSEVPARIVISEKEWAGRSDSEHYGLPRAWAVLEYLTTEQGLDKKYFSISASSAAAQKKFRSSEPDRPKGQVERMLEIVLLERSIYN